MHPGGKLVIVNLQRTPKDKKADLVISARCEEVMAALMRELAMPIPAFVREDTLLVRHSQDKPVHGPDDTWSFGFRLSISSAHGPGCPNPMVKAVTLSFPVSHTSVQGW
jgi:NAD+-dependent protein deacetylase sirtuin 6